MLYSSPERVSRTCFVKIGVSTMTTCRYYAIGVYAVREPGHRAPATTGAVRPARRRLSQVTPRRSGRGGADQTGAWPATNGLPKRPSPGSPQCSPHHFFEGVHRRPGVLPELIIVQPRVCGCLLYTSPSPRDG